MTTPAPRPVRNNNPLDIEAGTAWQGLLPLGQMTEAQASEPRFCVFQTPVWGFRAALLMLRNYSRLHGLRTIDGLVERLAPDNENPTHQYEANVARWTGFARDEVLDMESPQALSALVKACTRQECGGWEPWWSDQALANGLALMQGQKPIEGAMV